MFFFSLNTEHAEESTILPGFVGDDDDLVDDDDDDRCLITRSFDVQSEPAVSKRGWEKMVGDLWPPG